MELLSDRIRRIRPTKDVARAVGGPQLTEWSQFKDPPFESRRRKVFNSKCKEGTKREAGNVSTIFFAT